MQIGFALMSTVTWRFRTRNFTVTCEEHVTQFVDPLVHSEEVLAAVELGNATISTLQARIEWRGVEVGTARLPDCLFVVADDDENPWGIGGVFGKDESYRRKVVRWAISNARGSLFDLQSDVRGMRVRRPE
jgi:hypothetical protein